MRPRETKAHATVAASDSEMRALRPAAVLILAAAGLALAGAGPVGADDAISRLGLLFDNAVGDIHLAFLVPLDALQVKRSEGPKLLGPSGFPGCTVDFTFRLGWIGFAIKLRLKLGDLAFQAFHFPITRCFCFHVSGLLREFSADQGLSLDFVYLPTDYFPSKFFAL